ncbi:hypothetical protein Q604_UNBC07275G0001 [human gut metagenome]|uniref:Glycosyltransferase 2-like domain-containing protein n=1 Tax=human gut metagenome TaxID=408170 RepID=W1YAF8_9ZZZZ
MSTVTILTPTYNRAEELTRLYESIKKQNNQNFEWLIVDDGSTDNTEFLVNNWLKESKNFHYIKKENGGKHTALNAGIKEINSLLTFIVDSDDWLLPNAIEEVINSYEKYKREDICGIAFLRQSNKGGYLTNKLVPENGWIEDYCTCRIGRNITGDMAEVWMTSCLKEYPFPEFKGEKFLSEDVVWIAMAQRYKMVFLNKAIYISDYLDGGLTKNRRLHNIKSPKGCMYRGELQLKTNLSLKQHCKAMMYYIVYGKTAGYKINELLKNIDNKLLFVIWLIPSMVLYKLWNGKYKV